MAKFAKRIPGGRVGNFFAGAAVASVIGGTAVAITSPNFTYSAVQQGHYTIGPSALTPRGTDAADDYFINVSDLSGVGCYQTGVNLPQGASVNSVTTWYKSNVASNPGVFLYRHNVPNDGINLLVSASIDDDSNTRKPITHTVPANLRIVNNLYFEYSYYICLDDGTLFYGARINYTFKTAGD